ncbi:MAG: helix-turn-helix domain-containing protein [Clostridia bacterium]|nr:helix-turn-helix domain-containing protein [Clostridia bacterium]
MQRVNLSQLIYCDFDIKNITVGRTDFYHKHVYDCRGKGRRNNILHLVTEGERIYKVHKKTVRIPRGSIFLIPQNTEYETISIAKNSPKVSGIGICFDLVDQNGEKIELEKDVYCDFNVDALRIAEKIYLLEELYKTPLIPMFSLKSQLGQLLHSLCSSVFREPKELLAIKPALKFIAERYSENLPVKTYADQCSMSESNFRKKFVKCTGMSPIEYRNELRFEYARRLYAMNMEMQQIAESVGFSDANYLGKLYRRSKGSTLKKDMDTI